MKHHHSFCSVCNDKNDPRMFFHKDPSRKWLGIVINFAHRKARKIFIAIVIPMIMLPLVILGLVLAGLHKSHPALFFNLLIALGALQSIYTLATVAYVFRMAAKEIQNHPAP